MKTQDFEIIEILLSHDDIKDKDNYLLNFIIPHFEKNPKENSKIIVKLIMDKEVDPNNLRVKYLRKDTVTEKDKVSLPKQILDISPISLACQKYQNNALNFIIKYNGAIRQIQHLHKKIKRIKAQGSLSDYHVMIEQIADLNKK